MLDATYSASMVGEVILIHFQLSQIIILQFMEIKKALHDFLLDKSPSKSTSKYMLVAY
jgi:hypothetical protein